jgi:hypothetical protein
MRSLGNPLVLALLLSALLTAGCRDRDGIKVGQVAKGEPQGPVPQAAPPVAPPPTQSGITDEPPSDWQRQPPSSLRLFSYLVPGSGGARCEVSLVMLGGGAGGILENVNRWRGQIGLKPLDESGLARESQHLRTLLGEMTIVDMTGSPEKGDPLQDGRIIAGTLPLGEKTYFFKLRGNPELAGRRKQEFLKWIGTVRLPQ